MASNELNEARKELIDAAYFFLLRCYRMKLLDEKSLRIKCNEIGTSVDLTDLQKENEII